MSRYVRCYPAPVARSGLMVRKVKRPAGITWFIGAVQMPEVSVEGTKERPTAFIVVDSNDEVIAKSFTVSTDPAELEAALLDALDEARETPKPAAVVTDDAALGALCTRLLKREVQVRPLPHLDELRAEILSTVDAPATYLTPGIDATRVASLFDAAAELYLSAPWTVVPGDGHLFHVRCAELDFDFVATVIGQIGEAYGIVLYDDAESLAEWTDGVEAAQGGEELPEEGLPLTIGLHFDPGDTVPPEMRAEIKEHGWRIAGPAAFPNIICTDEWLGPEYPLAEDLHDLELAARVLAAIIERDAAAIRAWNMQTPKFEDVDVELDGKKLRVSVSGVTLD